MTPVFRGDSYELGGDRVITIRPIPGQIGRHVLVCEICKESAIARELFDGSEGFARRWIAKHENCERKQTPAKTARRKK